MSKDDKKRTIGKVVAINSDRITVELLTGIENFNISGYDDIHYFAQVNSYVVIPYQNYHIVAEVAGVKEKDTGSQFFNPTEQILSKAKSLKLLEVLPIGTIKTSTHKYFDFGVSVYTALYSDVLYIKEEELDCIFNVTIEEITICEEKIKDGLPCLDGDNKRLKALSIGKSTVFENYDVKIDIDKFFSGHNAILGNTGSGKSCTISSIIQRLFSKTNYSASGSTFILFDVNGEYTQAFSKLKEVNPDIAVRTYSLDESRYKTKGFKEFKLPHWFLNIDEWALLLQASEKTQLPILRNALGLAVLFSKEQNDEKVKAVKNHILATCITQILRDETSSPSKRDRVISILQKFQTNEINLQTHFEYEDQQGSMSTRLLYDNGNKTKTCNILNCLIIHFGGLIGIEALLKFLERKNDEGEFVFLSQQFSMPCYSKGTTFNFQLLEDALDLAVLYEEAHGNRQIRDYCSSMVTSFKSLKDRKDFEFLQSDGGTARKAFRNQLLGIFRRQELYFKRRQVIIIDLNNVEDEIVEIVSCVLSRIIYDALKSMTVRNTFPVNLILEEAHRYISQHSQREFLKANKIFESISKEGRKFGLFLTVSSQRPSELSKTVLSQCNNFIVHRIQNPEDLAHIRQITPHISEVILRRMPSIPTQHALVFGSAVNLPTLFKVNNANPIPLSDNNQISKNWFISKKLPLKTSFTK